MSSDDGTFVGDSEGSEQFFDASPIPPKPQPLFPTLSRPIHVDPAALASVPEPAQGCIILDPTSKLNALEAYDEGAMLFLQDPAAPPSDFTDPYVYPRLTKNERCVSSYSFSFESCPLLMVLLSDRLTALWYYTRDIHEDKVFLAHMQETLELLQDLIPRDHVIVGLSDKDSYINIAATHMPLAITNRKETLCSHTINMPGGTVLSIEDLKEDWRLKNNPHVTHGGVGSYVGTPLHCQVPGLDGSDSDVALGTLCATSSAPAEPLTATQQKALIRFSKIIVHDMIARARSIRSNERQAMAATLAELSKEVTATNADELVLSALRRTYPDTHVSIQRRPDGCVQLEGSEPVSYANLQGYLYEDTEQIDRDVLVANHIPNDAQPISRTLRAVAVKLTASQDSYLVVQTTRLTSIFDDIDSNFVHTCALILSNVRQAAELERAAAAKAVFLRGVSHELRTPIHALLSSCELLVEEVKAGRVAIVRGFQEGDALSNATESAELLHNALASGRALLTTVNSTSSLSPLVQGLGSSSRRPLELRYVGVYHPNTCTVLPSGIGGLSCGTCRHSTARSRRRRGGRMCTCPTFRRARTEYRSGPPQASAGSGDRQRHLLHPLWYHHLAHLTRSLRCPGRCCITRVRHHRYRVRHLTRRAGTHIHAVRRRPAQLLEEHWTWARCRSTNRD
jgi:hypothetical protein